MERRSGGARRATTGPTGRIGAPVGPVDPITPPAAGPPPSQRVLRQGLWFVLALAVIGISLFAGSLYFGRDAAGPSSAPSIAPLAPSSSAPPSTPPTSPSATPSQAPTAAGMTAFLDDYLQAVASDPATAWGRLTPAFQQASGGFAKYRAFWAPIARAVPSGVRADPATLLVAYSVRYTYADGHTTDDSTRLTLAFDQGSYRISGEG